jgi:hypothetical protein
MRRLARLLAVVTVGLLSASACKKKSASPEYVEARYLYEKLYDEKLSDAFVDPRMKRVEQLLERVSPDSKDASAAAALLTKLREGRARVEKENADRARMIRESLRPLPPPPRTSTPPPARPSVSDAGVPTQPMVGMSARELSARFSRCFQRGPTLPLQEGPVETYELKNLAVCRDLHPGFDADLLIIRDGKISQSTRKDGIRRVLADGGFAPFQ